MKIYLAGGITGNLKPDFQRTMKIYLAGTNGRRWAFEDYMKIFLADNHQKKYMDYDWKNSSVYILESFYYADEWVERHIPLFKDFLLDSGAFTFFSGNQLKRVNWVDYVDRYADFINKNRVSHFFELDIDKLIGYDKVIELRKRLELKTNKQCIPVWHKFRGKDNFFKMCDEYKYVAIGGIVSREIKPNEYPVFSYLINEAHKRKAMIHGLGFTNLEGLKKYKFDSVDSTAWTTGNRFGSIYQFTGDTIIKYNKKPGQRLANSREVALNNFTEWVKFQQYAERWL